MPYVPCCYGINNKDNNEFSMATSKLTVTSLGTTLNIIRPPEIKIIYFFSDSLRHISRKPTQWNIDDAFPMSMSYTACRHAVCTVQRTKTEDLSGRTWGKDSRFSHSAFFTWLLYNAVFLFKNIYQRFTNTRGPSWGGGGGGGPPPPPQKRGSI